MSKKALRLVLTVIITTSILFSAFVTADAEELTEPESLSVASEPAADILQEELQPTDTRPVSKANHPVLTVIATSNFFGRTDAYYDEYTKEVTVTYHLKAMKRLLNTQWELQYDSSVLSFDPEKNPAEVICPLMQSCCLVENDEEHDRIVFSASNLKLFDFTGRQSVFAKLVFDVADLSPSEAEITKLDLTVNELSVSEPNPVNGLSLSNKVTSLVTAGKVLDNKVNDKSFVTKSTQLTPSNYIESNLPATADQAVTTVPPTTVAPTVAAKPAPPKQPEKKPAKEGFELLSTGKWYVALLILAVLLACSTVLFILRKRDIYND